MTLAREGVAPVAIALAVAVVATLTLGGWALPFWLLFVFVVQFFRDPARAIVANDDEVVSPADGKVVFVGRADSPIDCAPSLKISVFMNVFNVHSNRAPAAGKVLHSRRIGGVFFNAALDKASEKNERHLISLSTKHGDIVCAQIAGLLARRVFCYAQEGDWLSIGQRYGFIRFGSRADLYLPPTMRPLVALGDSVTAGITQMAAAGDSESVGDSESAGDSESQKSVLIPAKTGISSDESPPQNESSFLRRRESVSTESSATATPQNSRGEFYPPPQAAEGENLAGGENGLAAAGEKSELESAVKLESTAKPESESTARPESESTAKPESPNKLDLQNG